jgi:hypothetical protein
MSYPLPTSDAPWPTENESLTGERERRQQPQSQQIKSEGSCALEEDGPSAQGPWLDENAHWSGGLDVPKPNQQELVTKRPSMSQTKAKKESTDEPSLLKGSYPEPPPSEPLDSSFALRFGVCLVIGSVAANVCAAFSLYVMIVCNQK